MNFTEFKKMPTKFYFEIQYLIDWLIDWLIYLFIYLFIGFGSQRLDYNVYIQTYMQ